MSRTAVPYNRSYHPFRAQTLPRHPLCGCVVCSVCDPIRHARSPHPTTTTPTNHYHYHIALTTITTHITRTNAPRHAHRPSLSHLLGDVAGDGGGARGGAGRRKTKAGKAKKGKGGGGGHISDDLGERSGPLRMGAEGQPVCPASRRV